MSDEAALLAAILAHPDEDTPRLMFADWLDEHGQPERAEFIRVQCELAQGESHQLRKRESELLALRREKLAALEKLGITPFGAAFEISGDIAQVREKFAECARLRARRARDDW